MEERNCKSKSKMCEIASRFEKSRRWNKLRNLSLTNVSVILFICGLTMLTTVQSQQTGKDPCNFAETFVYCNCDPQEVDATEVELAKCGVFMEPQPTSKEWRIIGRLTNLVTLEFAVRPPKILKFFIPRVIFHKMTNLTYFLLKMADVKTIPSFAFANSSSLREIVIESNFIRQLEPYAFANMPRLVTINLRENMLESIDRLVFVDLPLLQNLLLDKNNIQVIHDRAFADLGNLDELDIHNNNLTVIARDSFFGLKKLRRLDLRSNPIEFLGDHVFAEMPLLEDLDLNNCKIISVSSTAFAGLKELSRLALKGNKIVELHPRTFDTLHRIYFLDLRLNELKSLEEELIMPIYNNFRNSSTQLMIDGNRFICDCRILWIQDLSNETESTSVQFSLKNTDCDLFQKPPSRAHRTSHVHKGHHQGSAHGSYDSSSVTILATAPEETTSYAFESSRKVLELNRQDFDCQNDRVTSVSPQISSSSSPLSSFSSSSSSSSSESESSSEEEVLHLSVATTTEAAPVFPKKKNVMNTQDSQILSDTPDLKTSQSSLSSAVSSSSASGSSSSMRRSIICTPHHHFVLWLTTLAVFLISSHSFSLPT